MRTRQPAPPWRIPVGKLLTTTDQAPTLRAKAEPFLTRLRDKPQVLAYGLLGGLAEPGVRYFADSYSDIDIAVLPTCEMPAELLRLPAADAVAQRLLLEYESQPNTAFGPAWSGSRAGLVDHANQVSAGGWLSAARVRAYTGRRA